MRDIGITLVVLLVVAACIAFPPLAIAAVAYVAFAYFRQGQKDQAAEIERLREQLERRNNRE